LGEGGFGTVVLAKWRLAGGPEELYAIKAVKKKCITSISMPQNFDEKEALKLTNGYAFVATLYSCFQNKVCLNFLNFYIFSDCH
jgi:serine/threonine protein kinase